MLWKCKSAALASSTWSDPWALLLHMFLSFSLPIYIETRLIAALYQHKLAHPCALFSFSCIPVPQPWTWRDGLYEVWNYLTLTTWVDHGGWPMRNSHFLLWVLFHGTAKVYTILGQKRIHNVFLKIFIRKYCKGQFTTCVLICRGCRISLCEGTIIFNV
jgi:hypothetical protein